MTTVPLAIPLKRQGAADGPLLAFIITSSLLGPASIMLTFTMFGPVWGVFRLALPLIAVCGLGWGLQRFVRKPHSGGGDIDEASCSSACGCGGGDSGCSSAEDCSFWANLLSMIRNLVRSLLGLLAAAASVLIGKSKSNNGCAAVYGLMPSRWLRAYWPMSAREAKSPSQRHSSRWGVGIGPAFTFMQASVGTCLPTLMMLPKLAGVKLTVVYLAFWLVYSMASGIIVGWIQKS
jgi:uncharacterized membrane protein YraQ (UPF0718 family)